MTIPVTETWQPEGLKVIQGREVTESHRQLAADVVVVGSGAGGAVAAYELARRGLSVVVLEAGPYIPSSRFSEDFNRSMEALYEDHGGQANADGDLLLLQGRCVGGSTVVNGCVAFRTPDFILEDWQRDFGLTNLTPDTLRPYFERVERLLSINDNGEHEIATHSRVIRAGAQALGWSVKPFKRNVKDCVLTGHCLSGCKTDRKQSMLVTYLPWAVAHGADLYSDTRVTQVLVDQGRAAGVQAEFLGADGSVRGQLTVRAPRVILAAGAVQTPLLLLKSGLANSSDQVGRNFACHPSMMVGARYPQDIHPWRGALLGVYVDEFMHPDKGGFVLECGGLGVVEMTLLNEPGTGKPFMDYMANARRMLGLVTLIHDHNVGRVRLKNGRKVVDYRLADEDFPAMLASLRAAAELHLASGAEEVFLPTVRRLSVRHRKELDVAIRKIRHEPYQLRMVSYHPQGSCRMGADPATSVVGPHGESHDVPGLFVADASLLPTSIIVNPQVTVYALANYIADGIAAAAGKA